MSKNYRIIGHADKMSYEAWCDLRLKSIGGSEVASVLEMNPFCSKFELWARKTNHITSKVEQSEAMYWGNRLQSIIADEFEKRHKDEGFKVIETKAIFAHKDLDFLTANIDGYVDCGNGEFAVLEIKTTSAWNADSFNDSLPGNLGKISPNYFIQCMYYMMLLNGFDGHTTHGSIRKCYLACLVGGQTYKEFCIEYDEEVAKVIFYKACEFWKMVQENRAPEVCAKDNAIIGQVYNQTSDKAIKLGTEFEDILNQYAQIKEEEQRVKNEKDQVEARIKAAMGEAGLASCGQWNITYKTSIRNTFDSTVAKTLLSEEDVAKCIKQSQSRTLRVSQKKEKAAQKSSKK